MDEYRQDRAAFGLDETSGACRSSEERMQRKERRADVGGRRTKKDKTLLESVAMDLFHQYL